MTYLIIQPYCGNIMQYCSHLVLNNSDDTVVVLTIESNKHRIMNESKLFKLLRIRFRYFGEFDITDDDLNDRQLLMDIECYLQEFIRRFLKEYRGNKIGVVIPFGNSSKLGKFIREIIEKNISILYYYPDGSKKIDPKFRVISEVDISPILDIKKSIKEKFYKDIDIITQTIEKIYIDTEQELPF